MVLPRRPTLSLLKNYCLAADPDESSHVSYTQAADLPGIPAAFLVGKTGKIEWIGHPLEIDEPLELVVTDKFDAVAYEKEKAEREQRLQELQVAIGEVSKLARGGKVDEALAKLETVMEGAQEDEQMSLGILKVKMLGSVGKPDLAVKQLDEMIGKASGEDLTELKMLKFQIMVTETMPGAEKVFFEVAELAQDPAFQNSVAWLVVQMGLDGNAVSPEVLAKARALADAAVAAEPVPDVLETQAHLAFLQGEVKKAIAIQKRAIADARDKQLKSRLEHFLKKWQAELTPAKMEDAPGK